MSIYEKVKNAKLASKKIASIATGIKNSVLEEIADKISAECENIISQNQIDLIEAEKLLAQNKISKSVYNRLVLDKNKIKTIVESIKTVIKLEDPVNKNLWGMELDTGLELYRVSAPIGVIGVIFESRPDVIPQIVSLAVKSSNALILKGGSEAFNTNNYLFKIINDVINSSGYYPPNTINLVSSRDDVKEMLKMDADIDLLIPRGGNELVKYIKANTSIPVLGHSDGVCHIYVDEFFNLESALKIIVDAKCSYPSACNAVETILINKKAADKALPKIVKVLEENFVTVLGCKQTHATNDSIVASEEIDWSKEYSSLKVSIKTVESIDEAIDHINFYGSGHTDCIITEDKASALKFMNNVDSAGVYLNASTRFADGFRYGFGAEVGISTNKIHARGPVGLEGLVTYKYRLFGNGHVSADYSAGGPKKFEHKLL